MSDNNSPTQQGQDPDAQAHLTLSANAPAAALEGLPKAAGAPHEPEPSETVQVGVDTVGTVPHASATRVWSKAQLSNWRLYLIHFLVAGIAVVLTVLLVPGLRFTGWGWGEFVRIAVIFGLLNAIVKPLLQFLALRFILNTYGLVVVLINTVMLGLLGWLMPDQFQAERPLALLAGGFVVGVLGLVLETLLGANQPVLDRDYRERNGLA
ncbi:MAG: phage holin family protein [Candidatus Nanopelagicales bacterium]